MKENFDKAKTKVGEGFTTVKEKVTETVTSEEAKTFGKKVKDTVNKGIDALKGLFAKK